MIKCPSCASNLRYDIATATMKCDHCGSSYDPYQFENEEKGAELSADYAEENEAELPLEKRGLYQSAVFICPSCGAELACQETDVTAVCAYCGGANIVFDRIKNERKPEKIVPFSITKEQCKTAYVKAARRSFLTPGRLKSASQIESFRGIYIPYRECEASIENGTAQFTGKAPPKREGQYEYTAICEVELENFNGAFSSYMDGSVQFDNTLSECLEPYEQKNEKPFSPGFLSGFYAETYNDPELNAFANEFHDNAIDVFQDAVEESTKYTIGDEDFAIEPVQFRLKELMRPVWFMSYRAKNNDLAYAAVNGSTGKVVADFPISFPKYLGLSLAAAAVFFLLFTVSGFMLRPVITLAFTGFLAALGGLLNYIVYRGVFTREYAFMSDSPEKRKKRINSVASAAAAFFVIAVIAVLLLKDSFQSVGNVISGLLTIASAAIALITAFWFLFGKKRGGVFGVIGILLMLLAVGLTVSVQMLQPLNLYYYLASFANTGLFVIQFVLTVIQHNKSAYRRPPQFTKTGGDDDA